MGGRVRGWGAGIDLAELKITECSFHGFPRLLFPYSRFSKIGETNLDGCSARVFFIFCDFRFSLFGF